MTTDNPLLSDTHHDERTACQVKSILLHVRRSKCLHLFTHSQNQQRSHPMTLHPAFTLPSPAHRADTPRTAVRRLCLPQDLGDRLR